MIAVDTIRIGIESSWQSRFLAMLPGIEARLRMTFRYLGTDRRDESISEAIAHSLFAYVRLYERGRADVATASTLAFYSSRQVKRGRPAVGRVNSKEPFSLYAQLGHNIKVEQLTTNWIDVMVMDKRASVVELVAAKLDVAAWFSSLPQRTKQIAKDLAFGCSTSEVARKYGITSGRISQLRRTLEVSWTVFQT
jgi:DNA-binding CsgD family transcriptional regulator